MSRDHGPTDCCTYACTQDRNCPARGTFNTADGGQQVDTDTDLDTVYGWTDWFFISVRFLLLALSAGCVVMFLFRSFY